jgi:hypothetical protein
VLVIGWYVLTLGPCTEARRHQAPRILLRKAGSVHLNFHLREEQSSHYRCNIGSKSRLHIWVNNSVSFTSKTQTNDDIPTRLLSLNKENNFFVVFQDRAPDRVGSRTLEFPIVIFVLPIDLPAERSENQSEVE